MDKIVWNKEVGFKLRMLRQKAGWSQEKLAERVNLSSRQIQKYEAGSDNINIEKLQRFAAAFSVPIQEFFTGAGAMIPLQDSERILLDAFRAIENADIQESILKLTIHSSKVKA